MREFQIAVFQHEGKILKISTKVRYSTSIAFENCIIAKASWLMQGTKVRGQCDWEKRKTIKLQL